MPYLAACPIGCDQTLIPTHLKLTEGYLLQCPNCKQMISQCSEADYFASMTEFNVPEGTQPNRASLKRAHKVNTDRLRMIKNKLAKPMQDIKLLDVGCSSGAFLDTAKIHGMQTYGIEPAQKAAERAQTKGHHVKIGLLDRTQYSENSFDAITLFEVIEHLKNPLELLSTMRQILKPNGLIMISTGNTQSLTVKALKNEWDYFSIQNHGGHISFFNPHSMKQLANKAKLNVVYCATKNIKFANKNNQPWLKYRLLKIFSELLNPFIKLINQGHDLIVILQKPEQDHP